MKKIVAALLIASSGCTSSTIINSRPDGAEVSVDGQDIGTAPAQWSNTVWVGTQNSVRLSKKGYKDTYATIKADQWNIGKTILSVICFLPAVLVSTEYRPSYEFALKPEGGGSAESSERAPVAPIRLAEKAPDAE